MEQHLKSISPEKITTPIQLLGAWLAGLLAIDSCFLIAASSMDQTSWQSAILTIAAIFNVPIFIYSVFLLQTKFRPELQEDSYYSTYLNQKTNQVIKVPREEALLLSIQAKIDRLEHGLVDPNRETQSKEIDSLFMELSIGVNRHLSSKEVIQQRMFGLGVLGISDFGTDEPPKFLKVAFSNNLPKSVVKKIAEIACDLGFEYFGYYDHDEEDEIDEDILFGAYGEKKRIRIAGSANVPNKK